MPFNAKVYLIFLQLNSKNFCSEIETCNLLPLIELRVFLMFSVNILKSYTLPYIHLKDKQEYINFQSVSLLFDYINI